jgi:GNAT superfamily N-acetyltransferase
MASAQTAIQNAAQRPQPKPMGQQVADVLGGVALPMSAVPVVGDVAGLGADAAMYASYPEERTALNYGLTLAGMLPFVPSAAGVRAAQGAAEGALDMSQAAKAPAKVNVSETGIIKGGADRMMSQLPGRNVLNLWIEKGDEAIESGWNTTGDPVVVLDKIVIDPDLRQQGYGRRVLEQAIKDASEALPDGELKLLAEPLGGKDGIDSYDLVKFYESLGFSVDDYQEGMSGVPMSLMLR